jgi:hypothetical protein
MQRRADPAASLREAPAARIEANDANEGRGPHFRPGRDGKSNVTGYFPPEVKKQLRILAAERNTTIQDLLAEALNDLFAKNSKPEIAPVGGAGS